MLEHGDKLGLQEIKTDCDCIPLAEGQTTGVLKSLLNECIFSLNLCFTQSL